MIKVRNLWRCQMALGEGPVWDARTQVLWFVDIKRPCVHRFDPTDGRVDSWSAPTEIGWVLPAKGGTMLAGLRTGIARFDPHTGRFDLIASPVPHPAHNRLNDATIAPDGAIWFGSMDDEERLKTGRVFRFDGRTIAAVEIEPVMITNGPAISPNGRLLYHVDTAGGVIKVLSISEGQQLSSARTFVVIHPTDGHPDGVTVDSGGNVWVGLWGGGCARLYAPDATLLCEVKLPVSNVTKVTLGGANLTTAYVTTARIGLNEEVLAKEPESGSLFTFKVAVPGQLLPPAMIDR